MCNVGLNGREEFSSGLGDDLCQQFNVYTGQPNDIFPGLNEKEAKILFNRAVSALESAARQHKAGVRNIQISGVGNVKVGNPAVGIAGTRCTDFMSPKDCQLMFNVCDPVICPASRCNLGGKYPVTDVVQTGIVGSIFLCLPNYKEGIFIPVCLTGIHAGIDNYLSILKASQACLQEAVDNGRYVGICDEITAIYKCEFFWRQFAPLMNQILPKMLEAMTGKGTRGGGEYLVVQSAWDNMQKSIDYFKGYYGVNAMKAFQIRSTQEAGTQVCKSFVSMKYANKFKLLIEPDSPTQFSAWFDEIKQSDALVPPISQYKVYYHIFAGNDQGVYYSIYLKDTTGVSYFSESEVVQVATGFIGLGEYVDEAKDFTAPSNFQQLCVRINAQEQCGFKQVSTSFALNYARDKFMQQQILNKNVKTEKACVSGTPSAYGLLTPNLQSGVEDSLNPEIYNRGIIRICSTANPGLTTEPTRWVDVGYCDNQKVTCWLDQESVDRSMTDSNVGLKNATASELNDYAKALADIDKSAMYLDDKTLAREKINVIRGLVTDLIKKSNYAEKKKIGDDVIGQIDVLLKDFSWMNKDKVKLNMMRAEASALVAVSARDDAISKAQKTTTKSGGETETPTPEKQEVQNKISNALNKISDISDEDKIRSIFSENNIVINNQCGDITDVTVTLTCVAGIKEQTLWVIFGIQYGTATSTNNLVLTGGTDGGRGHVKDSAHYSGKAFDIRHESSDSSPRSNSGKEFNDDYKNTKFSDADFEKKYGFPKNAIKLLLEEKDAWHYHIEVDQEVMYNYIDGIGSSISSNTNIQTLIPTTLVCKEESGSVTDIYKMRYETLKSSTNDAFTINSRNPPSQFDEPSFKALLVAIAQKETSLGETNPQNLLMGYCDGCTDTQKKSCLGDKNQISCTATALKNAFNSGSGNYASCKNIANENKKLDCILQIYNQGSFNINNPDYTYANEVMGFFNDWKGYFCPGISGQSH